METREKENIAHVHFSRHYYNNRWSFSMYKKEKK